MYSYVAPHSHNLFPLIFVFLFQNLDSTSFPKFDNFLSFLFSSKLATKKNSHAFEKESNFLYPSFLPLVLLWISLVFLPLFYCFENFK